MKQNAGGTAVLVVVLTLFGITSLPNSPSAGSLAVGPKTKAKTTKKRLYKLRVRPVKKSALAFNLSSPTLHWGDQHLPGSCYESGIAPDQQEPGQQKDQPTPEVASFGGNFVVAAVPDPISTHLPLRFDRTIEVIQQAAQGDGYSYDSSWFPWNDSSKENLSVEDRQVVEEGSHR